MRGRLALADFGRLPRRSHLVVATVAILAAVAGTWPLALYLPSAVIDGARYVRPEDPTGWRPLSIAADVLTTTWVVGWDLHALWWQPTRFFEANVFHPTAHALALCEHFVATALLGVPGYLVDGPVLAHQSALLLCLAFNVWAMAWLVASWSGSLIAGIAAGLLFVTSPFHQRELVHLQSLGTHYFPVMLLALDRLGATGAARWAALGAVALALQVLSGQYLGVFAIVVWALASPLALVPVDRPGGAAPLASTMRGGAMLGLATAGAVVLVFPFVVPYLRLAAADLLLDNSNSLHATFGRRPWSYVLGEGRHAPIAAAQWVLVALGATACIRGSHRARLRGLVLVLVAVVGASLSGGRAFDFLGAIPLLERVIPGFTIMRVPGRWSLLPCLGAAVLAGLGVGWLVRQGRRSGLVVAGLLVAGGLAAPYSKGPVPMRHLAVGRDLPEVYRFLARCGEGDPLVELLHPRHPDWSDIWRDAEPTFHSAFHWLPLLNGRTGYVPSGYGEVVALAQRLPRPEATARLVHLTGVRWVLAHCDRRGGAACVGFPGATVVARRFGTVRLYDLGPAASPPKPLRRWDAPAECRSWGVEEPAGG